MYRFSGAEVAGEYPEVRKMKLEGAPPTAPSLGIDSDHGQARKGERRELAGACRAPRRVPRLVRPGKGRHRPHIGTALKGCRAAPRNVHLKPGAPHFMMCEFSGLAFKRTRLRKARIGWLRLCLEFLTGNFFWSLSIFHLLWSIIRGM